MPSNTDHTTVGIIAQLDILKTFIRKRLLAYFGSAVTAPFAAEGADQLPASSDYLFGEGSLMENMILLLALAPHMDANFYEGIIREVLPQGGDFPEFGGTRGSNHRGLLPTGETAQFILAGNDIGQRIALEKILQSDGRLCRENIVTVEPVRIGEPYMSGRLVVSEEYVQKIKFGKYIPPSFSSAFPAKLISTRMDWEDLVLTSRTAAQIENIRVWLHHNKQLIQDWNMGKKIKPGYRALFFGPAGTGKTLTATLLGKQFDKDVYRIDLSQIVSKFIGETEKNLEKVFSRAEHTDCILFFDEADALFGKRSNINNAQDKYANQETSYLLQRVEDHPGIIILASNFKNNMDSAFLRRFNAVISFPLPNVEERSRLWDKALPDKMTVPFEWREIAQKYEMSGAAIINVMHFAALRALSQDRQTLLKTDILDGIRDEFTKEDRFF